MTYLPIDRSLGIKHSAMQKHLCTKHRSTHTYRDIYRQASLGKSQSKQYLYRITHTHTQNGILPGIVMTHYITELLFTFGFPIHQIWLILCWLITTPTSHPLPKFSISHFGPCGISISVLCCLNKNWPIQCSQFLKHRQEQKLRLFFSR